MRVCQKINKKETGCGINVKDFKNKLLTFDSYIRFVIILLNNVHGFF